MTQRYLTLLAVLCFALLPLKAHAQLEIDITEGTAKPINIAVPAFMTSSRAETVEGTAPQVGAKIASVISRNLRRSGLFAPIREESFVRSLRPGEVRPEMSVWRAINAEALVAGNLTVAADGSITVEFRLWDVFAESQLTGLRYSLPVRNWRRVAHLISDAVYKRLTGERGYFDSRIVYISEVGPKTQRV
ncbi:MAG: Tol-Pal system protein TolB, partial [Pseudomonadota bacterium]